LSNRNPDSIPPTEQNPNSATHYISDTNEDFSDVTSFRTDKRIRTTFKDNVKSQGQDICFVLTGFMKAYNEFCQLGKANLDQILRMATQETTSKTSSSNEPEVQTGKPTAIHIDRLEFHNHYVVRSPRRETELRCQYTRCHKPPTIQARHQNGKQYLFCTRHARILQDYLTHIEPLKVNNCSSIGSEPEPRSDCLSSESHTHIGAFQYTVRKLLRRLLNPFFFCFEVT